MDARDRRRSHKREHGLGDVTMNPYSDITLTPHNDLTSFSTNDVTPSVHLSPAPLPNNQSEELQHDLQCQTDQLGISNPYADLVFPRPAPHATLVQSESVDVEQLEQLEAGDEPRCVSVVSARDLDPNPDLDPNLDANPDLDLDCSICFSGFNNAFRCPKRLQCGHTFCLECLSRMNMKAVDPGQVLCPFCRRPTPLPPLGPPKLNTDPRVLHHLPLNMQRVYSIRFQRSRGRLQLKRPDSALTQSSRRRSLDVGLPSPLPRGGARGGVGGALFRLTGRPACRAFLLTAVIFMILLLTGAIVLLLTIFRPQ